MDGRTAAVAAVLRENGRQVELLFIRRARRRGDPWSGHMAWPGGKREACDSSMAACSIRETREELGLDLQEHAHLIGTLPPLRFSGRRPAALRAVFAYVFALHDTQALQPGPEVQEAVWVPLTYFGRWSSRRPWRWVARWLPPVPPGLPLRRPSHLGPDAVAARGAPEEDSGFRIQGRRGSRRTG